MDTCFYFPVSCEVVQFCLLLADYLEQNWAAFIYFYYI